MKKIGVLGAGSWGTALTWLLTNNGHEVTLWSIMEAEVEMLRTKREHTSKLPGVKLQESIQLTSNLEEANGRQGCTGTGSAVSIYQKHRTEDGTISEKRPDRCQRGERCGRAYADDLKSDHRRRTAGSKCCRIIRSEPCGRGWKRSSDNLCGGKRERDR